MTLCHRDKDFPGATFLNEQGVKCGPHKIQDYYSYTYSNTWWMYHKWGTILLPGKDGSAR